MQSLGPRTHRITASRYPTEAVVVLRLVPDAATQRVVQGQGSSWVDREILGSVRRCLVIFSSVDKTFTT